MQNENNFNAVAPFYDWLSRLVFGQSIRNTQITSLKFIPAGSAILIAGGGTGWILEEIAKSFPEGLNITYIDKSFKMIMLSKKRNLGLNRVDFIHGGIENIDLQHHKYDVILTPFFLDCFSEKNLSPIFEKLHDSLKDGGRWINIDFYLSDTSKYWQKAVVKIMYTFFRFSCNIDAKKLPHINKYFSDYTIVSQAISCKNFISMQVFQKN